MQINTSFASDEDIKNEILDLILETKRIWDTQNYSNLKSLWDAEDNNPLYIPEEKVDFPTDWNSLERYWNPVPGKKILDGIRNDYSNIKIKLISKEVAIIIMDLNYDLQVINSQPLSGFDRIMCVVVKKNGDNVYVGLKMESVQSSAASTHILYAGTKELQILEKSGHQLVRLMDYGWFGNKFAFLVKPLLKVLQYFYDQFNNYGWAIIFVTIIVKIIFFPLTHKSFKSMKGMQKVQPYVKVIQERHKNDRQKMNEEMLELYKKHKVNPLGGCLPMLLQIPVFIALYHALFFSIELRGAPFIGWIDDLSVADPYLVWPIAMGASM